MEKDGEYVTKMKFSMAFIEDNCTISVTPWSEWNKMLVRITKYVNYGDWCLSMSQGKVGDENPLRINGFAEEYCSTHLPWVNYPFVFEKLYLSFNKQNARDRYLTVFECVVTVFKDEGSCEDYKCDNTRCIPNDLNCNEYNPCGDSSDCRKPKQKSSAALFGKVIGVILGVAAAVVLTMICVRFCMAATGKDSDEWESESRPQMEVERTPSLHESDWESETRDADRFYSDSLSDRDLRNESTERGRQYSSDESFQIGPFYTSDGRPRTPIYDSREEPRRQSPNRQENVGHNGLPEVSANLNVMPPASHVSYAPSTSANVSETEGIEMTPVIVHESDSERNDRWTPSDVIDYELPPPSYESVMASSSSFPSNS